MRRLHVLFAVLIVAAFALLLVSYQTTRRELASAQVALAVRQTNIEVRDFTALLIDDVLRADDEVGFETRLRLENAVREIGDEAILAQWQKFTGAKTEREAQRALVDLLGVLVGKIIVR
ncbi:MAG: hypothetical protein V1723_04750 [Candidatus Uhrbacteria bacterium]